MSGFAGIDLSDLVHRDLRLCGCGDPISALRVYRRALRKCAARERAWPWNRGMACIVLGVLDHAELIEHGTSITHSWLTPKGEKVLAWLECIPNDDDAADAWYDREVAGICEEGSQHEQ